MTERLLEFVQLLRRNGVRVPTTATLDAVRAVELVGLGDPESVRAALVATLAKRPTDEETVVELFDLYFRRGEELEKKGEAPLLDVLRARGFTDEEIEALLAVLADEAARMGTAARMGLGLRRGTVEGMLRTAGVQVDLSRMLNPMQLGFFAQEIQAQLQLREVEGQIGRLRDRVAKTLGEARADELAQVLGEQLASLRREIRRHVAAEFERRNLQHTQEWRAQVLADKPFAQLTDAEIAQLRQEVQRLARRLRQLATLRPRTERRGRLDARRTLRRSLSTGGVPFVLKKRRRKIEKPRLVVLCDISDSVRHVSRFMLEFAYSLQDQFAKVRSFVFVSDVAEVTELFAENELGRAVELANRGAAVNVFANSNYGRALVHFRERHLDAVTPKTTVLVIGDGRNNYNPAEAWALGDVRAAARRVLWFNPEAPLSWAFGDSAMREYQPHCHKVAVVNSLSTLARAVDELLP